MQLHDAKDQLAALPIKVKIVTFDNDFLADSYIRKSGVEFPLLFDKDTTLYQAYDIPKAGWWTLYNPLAILKYLVLMFSGTMPGKPGKDFNQLGGDVLIDPNGIVRMHYASKNPLDRPSVASILNRAKKFQP